MLRVNKNTKINIKNRKINPLIWGLLVVYIVLSLIVTQLFNIEASRLSGIILLSPIALMLLVSMLISNGKIRLEFSYFHFYILMFGLFCLFSSLWATSADLAISKAISIINVFVIMMIISACLHKTDVIDPLLKAIMWAYYIVIIYEIVFFGWSYFVEIMRNSSRITSEFLNSNTLGISASYAVLINLYFIFSRKTPLWTVILVLLGVAVIAATGSRKALVSLVLGIFLYTIFRNLRNNQLSFSVVRFLIIFPIFLFVTYQVLQLPMFGGIMERFEGMVNIVAGGAVDKSAMIRISLVQLGMRLFLENPILGVGIDNPRLYTYSVVGETFYLHNNYIELIAAGGIVGTIIYYGIYIKLFFSYIKHRDFADPQYCVCFVLLLLTLILDYGMVSYYSKMTFLFLLLFVKFDEKLKIKNSVTIEHRV